MGEDPTTGRQGGESVPLVPSGKSLFYASPGVTDTAAEQERERSPDRPEALSEDPEWTKLVVQYYSGLSEALEKTTTTAMMLLELAIRVKRDAEALLVKAQAGQPGLESEVEHLRVQRTALAEEVASLRSTRDRLRNDAEEILADTLERIRRPERSEPSAAGQKD